MRCALASPPSKRWINSVPAGGEAGVPLPVEAKPAAWWADSIYPGAAPQILFLGEITVYLFSVQYPDKGNDVVLDNQTDPVIASRYPVVVGLPLLAFSDC